MDDLRLSNAVEGLCILVPQLEQVPPTVPVSISHRERESQQSQGCADTGSLMILRNLPTGTPGGAHCEDWENTECILAATPPPPLIGSHCMLSSKQSGLRLLTKDKEQIPLLIKVNTYPGKR